MKRKKSRSNKKNAARLALFTAVCLGLVCIFIIIGKSSVKTNASETAQTYYTSVTIEKGDSLSSIAEEYGMSVEELKSINDLDSNVIYAGEDLIVAYKK